MLGMQFWTYCICRRWRWASWCSECCSPAGRCRRWDKCPRDPRVSGCRCWGPASLWCLCAGRPQRWHRQVTDASDCLHSQSWGPQGPDLEKQEKMEFLALYSYCVTHLCLFRFYEGIFGLTNIWQSFLWDRNKEFEWSRISCLHAYNKRLPTCDSINFVVGEVSCDAGHMCTETVA